MWVDICNFSGLTDPVYDIFQTAACKALVWRMAADKQGGVIIRAGGKVVLKMDAGSCIEIRDTFLITFAKYDDIVI